MRVIAHVLCKIEDDRLMDEQMDESPAVAEIVNSYNILATRTFALDDPDLHLCVVGAGTYGREFKNYLTYLAAPDRWRLIDRYLANFPQHAEGDARTERDPMERRPVASRETEAEKETRRLRHWIIRFALVMLFLVLLLVLVAVVGVMQKNDLLPDNVVFKTIMETATELAKILFTLK